MLSMEVQHKEFASLTCVSIWSPVAPSQPPENKQVTHGKVNFLLGCKERQAEKPQWLKSPP